MLEQTEELSRCRLKVRRHIEEMESIVRNKCSVCVMACLGAFENTNPRIDNVPNQSMCVTTMRQRRDLVMAITVETLRLQVASS